MILSGLNETVEEASDMHDKYDTSLKIHDSTRTDD
jgi:hypothetical protein